MTSGVYARVCSKIIIFFQKYLQYYNAYVPNAFAKCVYFHAYYLYSNTFLNVFFYNADRLWNFLKRILSKNRIIVL